jgi:hypothetical protein
MILRRRRVSCGTPVTVRRCDRASVSLRVCSTDAEMLSARSWYSDSDDWESAPPAAALSAVEEHYVDAERQDASEEKCEKDRGTYPARCEERLGQELI